jgi:UDP-N-acetylglucosamine 2-epimerase (non-hydrolysing)
MLKLMTIVGTRPELIKMSRVIPALDKNFRHLLIHTGQNYDFELNKIFFEELGIRQPDYFLEAAGDTPADTVAKVISLSDKIMEKEKPDALLIYGDTNSCMAAYAAKRRRIPVFHMEAGNRCFDDRVPEEINRRVIDHISDINLVITEHARRYLLAEGIRGETVIKIGSHMDEVLSHFASKIEASTVVERLGLKAKGFFLLSAHREENVDRPEKLKLLAESLQAVTETYNLPVLFSAHPRTRNKLSEFGVNFENPLIRVMKPFGFIDYIRLQKEAFCVLSDSGTISEEASLLNLRAITLRDAHERPEGMDEGTLIMSSIVPDRLLSAIKIATEGTSSASPVADYKGGEVSAKIVKIVQSYTDYVNRTVWRRASE